MLRTDRVATQTPPQLESILPWTWLFTLNILTFFFFFIVSKRVKSVKRRLCDYVCVCGVRAFLCVSTYASGRARAYVRVFFLGVWGVGWD